MPEPLDPWALPELTRGLRLFALPSAADSDHARFFAPVLSARRAAHEAPLWSGRLEAFDAGRLRGEWDELLAGLAADRFGPGGDRRALQAELEELTAAVPAALDAVARTAAAVRDAADDQRRRQAWERWVGSLRSLWVAVDEGWAAVLPVLADSRGRRGRHWRRVLRRPGP